MAQTFYTLELQYRTYTGLRPLSTSAFRSATAPCCACVTPCKQRVCSLPAHCTRPTVRHFLNGTTEPYPPEVRRVTQREHPGHFWAQMKRGVDATEAGRLHAAYVGSKSADVHTPKTGHESGASARYVCSTRVTASARCTGCRRPVANSLHRPRKAAGTCSDSRELRGDFLHPVSAHPRHRARPSSSGIE